MKKFNVVLVGLLMSSSVVLPMDDSSTRKLLPVVTAAAGAGLTYLIMKKQCARGKRSEYNRGFNDSANLWLTNFNNAAEKAYPEASVDGEHPINGIRNAIIGTVGDQA